ncbi:MAG: hypothetical protein K8S97_16365 [Anaerolineae bacterium]|nr:hypothetical protein [Anaerolineae bacterium]
MDVLRALERLFEDHAPETLMAFFGAGTSILLFYLVVTVLRHWFGWQTMTAGQEANQDQAAGAVIEALVNALVTEAVHLRTTMDSILREALRRGEENADLLSGLVTRTEGLSRDVVQLLKPEFEALQREVRQAERRIITKVLEAAPSVPGDVVPLPQSPR